jgi:uncharacterized protein
MKTPTNEARLLTSQHGWWYLKGSGLALLPRWAATPHKTLTLAGRALLRSQKFDADDPRHTYYLTVITTTTCNLGCPYCFQNVSAPPEGTHRPPRIPAARLTTNTISRIVDFARTQMANVNFSRLDLMLFGGEPLLEFGSCIGLLRQCQELGLIGAQVITNGTLLTPRVACALEAEGVNRIQVTFDGPEETHDTIRVTRSGQRTFTRILSNLTNASEKTSLTWQLRVQISHKTRSKIPGLLDSLAGAVDPSRARITFALVNDVDVGYDNRLQYSSDFAREFIEWNERALDLGFDIKRPVGEVGCHYCGEKSGLFGAVVNADGVLYSCWESAGKPKFAVGDVDHGYFSDRRLDERWVACAYDARPHASTAEQARFNEVTDAAILDALYERARL